MSSLSVSYSVSSILKVAMLKFTPRFSVSICVITLSTLASSLSLAEEACQNDRVAKLRNIEEYILNHNISIEGQDFEVERLRHQIKNTRGLLETTPLEINAQTKYSYVERDLNSIDENEAKQSSTDISLTSLLSVEQMLTKSKLRKTLRRLDKDLSLLVLRQRSEVMLQLVTLANLSDLLANAQSKLPIIQEQIEYFEILQQMGKSKIQELSSAELAELKAENEIINLQSKIQVELSKLVTDLSFTPDHMAHIPRVTIGDLDAISSVCQFFDPELDLKMSDNEISVIEIQIAKSKKVPTAKFSVGLGTTDYHAGAYQNSISAGITITGQLYAGGNIDAGIADAEGRYNLSMLELSRHKVQFEKKRENFIRLEHSLVGSIKQAKEQVRRNEVYIKELTERTNAGFSVFEDLSQRKLQRLELTAIVLDLESRLVSFWVRYLENFIEPKSLN